MAKWGRGAWAAIAIGVFAVPVAALVLLREPPSRVEPPDPRVNEGPTSVPADASTDASDDETFAEACTETEKLEAVVKVSFRSFLMPYLSIGGIGFGVGLSEPFFAKEFSADELCSTEASSPSHLRIVCLGRGGEPTTVEVRVEDNGRALDGSIDGVPQSLPYHDKPAKSGPCLALKTAIPKRDLTPLQAAFLDDSPSERCGKARASSRRVPVSFERIPLPRNHEYPELGVRRYADLGRHRICRDISLVKLRLPFGGSVNFREFKNQCDLCKAKRHRKPNGASFQCDSTETVSHMFVYQLGDHLYYTDDDRIRRVPLPCGVEVDFRMNEFAEGLGILPDEIE